MIAVTLVLGPTAAAREAAIVAAVNDQLPTAILLEGLPDARSGLEAMPALRIARIAPGCLCCTGNLTMRVMLNRMLRTRPARVYIGLATAVHLDGIRAFLSAPPYNNLLALTQELHA